MKDTHFFKAAYYKYTYRGIGEGRRVAIVIDLCKENSVSVTNSVETIADKLKVKDILYLASDNQWCYWNVKLGFDPLCVKDAKDKYIPVPTFDIAWDVIKSKYLSKEELA